MKPYCYLLLLSAWMFVIRAASAQTLSFNVDHIACNGQQTGAIDLTLNGGNPPFAIEWSNGSATEDIANLAAGTYTVVVTDNLGASVSGSATVTEPAALGLSTATTMVRCSGEANGAVALTVSGGVLPYSYKWSGGPTTPNLNGATAGTYTVTVRAANGCSATTSASVTEPPPLSWFAGSDNPSCENAPDGQIDLGGAGGTPPYNYFWSDGSTEEDRNMLTAGLYGFTVSDAQNCLQSGSVNLTAGNDINITVTGTSPGCGTANGTLSVAVNGGAPPYTYSWNNSIMTAVVSNLPTGTYTVTVTDSGGCTATASRTLGAFNVSASINSFQCGYNVNLSASGGSAPYTYLWSNGGTSSQTSGLPSGFYTLTVTDASDCTVLRSIELAPLVSPVVEISTVSDVCTGGLTAHAVNFEATMYIWSTGATSPKISNIPAGTYTVTVFSQSSCPATATVTTTQALSSATFNYNLTAGQVTCPMPNIGSINLINPSGSAPPFSYLWSTGATTLSISGLSAGSYTVTISDANGCTKSVITPIAEPTPPNIMLSGIIPVGCNDLGSINIFLTGGALPYTYLWTNGSTTQDIQQLDAGTYTVTATGGNGCSSTAEFSVTSDPPFTVDVAVISNDCNSATLQPVISGSTGPYQYAWSGPNNFNSNTAFITVSSSGSYTITVTSITGCIQTLTYNLDILNNGACGTIAGTVIYDLDSNCIVNSGDFGLSGWLVRAFNAQDTLYAASNAQGNYLLPTPVGSYTLELLPPNGLWTLCPGTITADVTEGSTVAVDSFLVKGILPCPALSVSIGTSLLRRCFSSSYYVNYCNQGTITADNAYVQITLDPFLTPVSATIPYTDLGDGLLQFSVGDLDVGECGSFVVQVLVSCESALGQAHCTEAHIYPDGDCLPSSAEWSGASLDLSAQCDADSVRFFIKNIGTGNMQGSSDYIVVEDAVMLMIAPFQLAAGEQIDVAFPANGSTWRVELKQEPNHPGFSAPALSVEGCTTQGSFSTGFVTPFANDEADPWIDIDCTQNIGSFDPNDKQGFPTGYGPQHYIRPGTELEYLIRFQNTGTDTAFTVRVLDTLSGWLDPATIRPGVSSHPYTFNLSGAGIAEFLFENILLPDSNINQVGSNGFLKFTIYPKAEAPLETVLENEAAIFFDFNEPVITNTTRHRLGENFLTVGLWQPQRPEYNILVSPNPFHESALLEVKGLTSGQPLQLQIMDVNGRIVQEESSAGPVLTLKRGALKAGIYLFRVDQQGVVVGSGKLIVLD